MVRGMTSDSTVAKPCRDSLLTGLALCWLTSMVCIAAACAGASLLPDRSPRGVPPRSIERLSQWDGQWYKSIVTNGYEFRAGEECNVAFWPLYPLAAGGVSRLTGLDADWSLALVANLSLGGAAALMLCYSRQHPARVGRSAELATLSMLLFPTSMFLRCAYSEALFLLLALAAMYGMRQRWRLWVVALMVGLASAARPVGVALLTPLAIDIWQRAGEMPSGGDPHMAMRPLARRFVNLSVWLPLGCWGLMAYIGFLHFRFGEPLAYALAQQEWHMVPRLRLAEKLPQLLTGAPLWRVYIPDSLTYWATQGATGPAAFNLQFANPLYFLLALALVAVGASRRWLSMGETALAAGLLLVPYVTRGYEMGMNSAGRFVIVVFPIYLVIGQLLARVPVLLAMLALAASAIWMTIYAAMFGAGHRIF
jgi:hypothetical protein